MITFGTPIPPKCTVLGHTRFPLKIMQLFVRAHFKHLYQVRKKYTLTIIMTTFFTNTKV